jgi:hypothetical protein
VGGPCCYAGELEPGDKGLSWDPLTGDKGLSWDPLAGDADLRSHLRSGISDYVGGGASGTPPPTLCEIQFSIHKFGDSITAASSARGRRRRSTRTECLHTTPSIPCSATAPYAHHGGKRNGMARDLPQADQPRSQTEGHTARLGCRPLAAQHSAQRPRPVHVPVVGTWRSPSRIGVAARAAPPPPICLFDGRPLSMETARGTWTRRSSSRRRPRQRPTTCPCPPQRHGWSSRARGAVQSPRAPGAAVRYHSSSLRARRSDGGGNRWSSVAISGNRWSSVVISGHSSSRRARRSDGPAMAWGGDAIRANLRQSERDSEALRGTPRHSEAFPPDGPGCACEALRCMRGTPT